MKAFIITLFLAIVINCGGSTSDPTGSSGNYVNAEFKDEMLGLWALSYNCNHSNDYGLCEIYNKAYSSGNPDTIEVYYETNGKLIINDIEYSEFEDCSFTYGEWIKNEFNLDTSLLHPVCSIKETKSRTPSTIYLYINSSRISDSYDNDGCVYYIDNVFRSLFWDDTTKSYAGDLSVEVRYQSGGENCEGYGLEYSTPNIVSVDVTSYRI